MPAPPRARLPRSARAAAWLALALGLGGCMRSGPLATDLIDCGAGALVIIDASALCVYRPADAPLLCPEALPNRFDRSGAVVCARQSRPAAGLVERAVDRVLDSDGGLFIVDAALGDGPRFQIVDGGATGADF